MENQTNNQNGIKPPTSKMQTSSNPIVFQSTENGEMISSSEDIVLIAGGC